MRVGVAEAELVTFVLFSLHVNDIPTPFRHVELLQYSEIAVLVAKCSSPSLLVGYL
jgi:hypothetical protein